MWQGPTCYDCPLLAESRPCPLPAMMHLLACVGAFLEQHGEECNAAPPPVEDSDTDDEWDQDEAMSVMQWESRIKARRERRAERKERRVWAPFAFP